MGRLDPEEHLRQKKVAVVSDRQAVPRPRPRPSSLNLDAFIFPCGRQEVVSWSGDEIPEGGKEARDRKEA